MVKFWPRCARALVSSVRPQNQEFVQAICWDQKGNQSRWSRNGRSWQCYPKQTPAADRMRFKNRLTFKEISLFGMVIKAKRYKRYRIPECQNQRTNLPLSILRLAPEPWKIYFSGSSWSHCQVPSRLIQIEVAADCRQKGYLHLVAAHRSMHLSANKSYRYQSKHV